MHLGLSQASPMHSEPSQSQEVLDGPCISPVGPVGSQSSDVGHWFEAWWGQVGAGKGSGSTELRPSPMHNDRSQSHRNQYSRNQGLLSFRSQGIQSQ
jgi:hypothetical protein